MRRTNKPGLRPVLCSPFPYARPVTYIRRTLAGGWGEPDPTRASLGHGGTTRGPAQRTNGQSEGRAKRDGEKNESARPRRQYRGRSPKAPARLARTVEELSTCRVLCAPARVRAEEDLGHRGGAIASPRSARRGISGGALGLRPHGHERGSPGLARLRYWRPAASQEYPVEEPRADTSLLPTGDYEGR